MSKFKTFIKNLGPGLLFASMAIGTSHLVLSTKAGAQYGWLMIIPIVLANLFKYPFFEFGVRYTHITDKTAGLFINLFKVDAVSLSTVALGLFLLISALLIVGRYRFLENSLKLVVSVLFIALLVTTILVVYNGQIEPAQNFTPIPLFNEAGILFLIGLMGWMPTTVEASSWVSLWSIEKWKSEGTKPSLKQALQEFNTGYILTGVLAIFFLTIGCMTLYGTGTELSGNGVVFADQVVTLFTTHIGSWSYIFIAVSAFATMFSTCMTAHDAVARVSLDILGLLYKKPKQLRNRTNFGIAILMLAAVNFVVIAAFSANMGQLVALATFVSFVVAPIIGYMNLKNVMSDDVPHQNKPKKWLQILTYFGIVFLACFSLLYFWMILFP